MQLAFAKNTSGLGSLRGLFRIFLFRKTVVAGFAALLFSFGCTTSRLAEVSPGEKQRKDQVLGIDLVQRFETEFEFRPDSAICLYLDELSAEMTRTSLALNNAPPKVMILKDPQKKWRNFGFPGNRIYLSRSLLRSIKFENELAAAIALEIAHVTHRDLIQNHEGQKGDKPWTGSGGLFEFSLEARQSALEAAMELMYQAGIDPRGMVRLLGRYQENPEKAPYEEATLKLLVENSWRIIALHAPLRNPIIRSDRFLTVYQRMQKL